MRERSIAEEDVGHALRHSVGALEPGSSVGTTVMTGTTLGGRLLKVVRSAADDDFVITVYWKEEQP